MFDGQSLYNGGGHARIEIPAGPSQKILDPVGIFHFCEGGGSPQASSDKLSPAKPVIPGGSLPAY